MKALLAILLIVATILCSHCVSAPIATEQSRREAEFAAWTEVVRKGGGVSGLYPVGVWQE